MLDRPTAAVTPVTTIAAHSALVDENMLVDWLVDAKPGDRIIYYRGHLAFDRTPSAHVLDGPSRAIVPVVANRVMALAEKGLALPVQKRIASNDCLYIAVKALPGRVVSHRVDVPPPLRTGSETSVAMPAHPAPAPLAA